MGFPGGSELKNPPGNVRYMGSIPGSEDPLEKEVVALSSILGWTILWTEEPAELQSMGSQTAGHDLAHTGLKESSIQFKTTERK